jgi:hypothetical protein
MERASVPILVLAPVLNLVTPGTLHAHQAPWSYTWTPSAAQVDATTGSGAIKLFSGTGTGTGESDIIAAGLESVSSAGPDTPEEFADAGYSLTLDLLDEWSQEAGTLTFSGSFTGTLSATGANINNAFHDPEVQELTLGGRTYTVSIGPYSPPGAPGTLRSGIGANVAVSGPDMAVRAQALIQKAPEPSSLALGLLGVSSLGLAGWWKRRRCTRPAAA